MNLEVLIVTRFRDIGRQSWPQLGSVVLTTRRERASEEKEPSFNSIGFINHVLQQFEVEWSKIA